MKSLAILCCMVNTLTADTFGLFTYTDNGTTISITDYPNNAVGDVVIPETINGKPVVEIYRAFDGCSDVTSVTIPTGVTKLYSFAFQGCAKLTSIIIPNSVTTINAGAFASCSGLTNVIIPASVINFGGVETFFGSYPTFEGPVFSNCTGLNAITVDSANPSFSSLDGVMFNKEKTVLIQHPQGRSGSYSIPNSVTMIGGYAFQGCPLTSVTIPGSVTSIGNNAFQSCPLTSLTIPGSVTSIGNSAFRNCGFTNVSIPASVGYIGDYAFSGGPSSVTISGVSRGVVSRAFDDNQVSDLTIIGNTTGSGGSLVSAQRLGVGSFWPAEHR